MTIQGLIAEFGSAFETSKRLYSELYNLNIGLKAQDPIATKNDYAKVRDTFRELRTIMSDLDRTVAKTISDEPSSPPQIETDPLK